MADTKIVETDAPAADLTAWQPGDCDPELTELFRSTFPGDDFERLFHDGAGRVADLKRLAFDDE